MDEKQLYETVGRLYSELLAASQMIQNQNNVIAQQKERISSLELSSAPSTVEPILDYSISDQQLQDPVSNQV